MIRGTALAALAAGTLSGCAAMGDLVGAIAGVASGAVTGNPGVAIAVGIALRAGTNEASDRVALARRRNEQDAIASAAATLDAGHAGVWAVDQRIAGDAQGEVRVLRVIVTPIATCKELLFSVAKASAVPRWFTTTACGEGEDWKWAAAEPATERWLNLQ